MHISYQQTQLVANQFKLAISYHHRRRILKEWKVAWHCYHWEEQGRPNFVLLDAKVKCKKRTNWTARATTIREATLKAMDLGFKNLIVMCGSKEIDKIWANDKKHQWKLASIMEDLKRHHRIQLDIRYAPSFLLTDAESFATTASRHFVNVFQVASNTTTQFPWFFAKY